MTIAEAIYLLCAGTSLAAAVLLLRQYTARRSPILLWSCIGFLGLAVNNVFVYLDFALLPEMDLALPRSFAGAAAMVALVYGLLRETT
jgi:hypothetical protein